MTTAPAHDSEQNLFEVHRVCKRRWKLSTRAWSASIVCGKLVDVSGGGRRPALRVSGAVQAAVDNPTLGSSDCRSSDVAVGRHRLCCALKAMMVLPFLELCGNSGDDDGLHERLGANSLNAIIGTSYVLASV